MIGTPYRLGSDDPINGGVDCWGLVRYLSRTLDGIELPALECYASVSEADRVYRIERDAGYEMLTAPTDGCVMCCFGASGQLEHVGRVMGRDFIHATSASGVIAWKLRSAMRRYSMGGRTYELWRYNGTN